MSNLGNLGLFFAGFFGGLGVFFVGIGALWKTSLESKSRRSPD